MDSMSSATVPARLLGSSILCLLLLACSRETPFSGLVKGSSLFAVDADEIGVDVRDVIRNEAVNALGLNLDYLVDHDANRPNARPLAAAIKEMCFG